MAGASPLCMKLPSLRSITPMNMSQSNEQPKTPSLLHKRLAIHSKTCIGSLDTPNALCITASLGFVRTPDSSANSAIVQVLP